MADKWTIADGININRKTKYNGTSNMSLDNDPVYGQAIDTAKKDAQSILVDAPNFSGTMSDEAQQELSDVNAQNANPLNRASTDYDVRSDGTLPNPTQSVLSDDEMDTLNDFSKSYNEYVKQTNTAQSTFLWTNNVYPTLS